MFEATVSAEVKCFGMMSGLTLRCGLLMESHDAPHNIANYGVLRTSRNSTLCCLSAVHCHMYNKCRSFLLRAACLPLPCRRSCGTMKWSRRTARRMMTAWVRAVSAVVTAQQAGRQAGKTQSTDSEASSCRQRSSAYCHLGTWVQPFYALFPMSYNGVDVARH